jgi:hypothetical protein
LAAFAAGAVLLLAAPGAGAPGQGSSAAAPASAALPEGAKQFDFWIGTWSTGGSGVDKVKRFGKGVAILEKYNSGSLAGWSVNVYDVESDTWTQTWQTNTGNYFQVRGRKRGDDIVLEGEITSPRDGKRKLLRLTFAEITRDSFKQLYDESEDGGETWTRVSTVPFTRMR